MTLRILFCFCLFSWSQGFHLSPALFYQSSSHGNRYGKAENLSKKGRPHVLYANDGSKGLFGGYKFGSITKGLLKKTASAINEVTGNEEYIFGDLTKNVVRKFTGKDNYQWGDITTELVSKGGSFVSNFTGKEEYVVGDISKEIIRKVSDGEYKLDDVLLLFKLLLTFGVGLTPVASALPVKLLLELINYSLATEVGERMLGALATTLDERFKEALTGNKDYKIGDLSKQAIMDFVGKSEGEYEFGDISRAISKKLETKDTKSFGGGTSIDPKLLAELEMLDNATLEPS